MTRKSKVVNLGFSRFRFLYNGLLPIERFAAPEAEVSETVRICLDCDGFDCCKLELSSEEDSFSALLRSNKAIARILGKLKI